MPRGGPDGTLQPYGFASQVKDIGAIYQMLWGFAPIDSQGRPIFLDTFNNGLAGWLTGHTGAGNNPILNSGNPQGVVFSPPNCVEFNPGIVLSDLSTMVRSGYLGQNTRLGLEVGFMITLTSPDYVFVLDYLPITGLGGAGYIKFSHSFHAWQYWNGSSFVTFYDPGTITIPGNNFGVFVQAKFVADFAAKKFVRVFIGDQSFDMSSISLANTGVAWKGSILATLRCDSYGAGSSSGYYGYCLLTKDEP